MMLVVLLFMLPWVYVVCLRFGRVYLILLVV